MLLHEKRSEWSQDAQAAEEMLANGRQAGDEWRAKQAKPGRVG